MKSALRSLLVFLSSLSPLVPCHPLEAQEPPTKNAQPNRQVAPLSSTNPEIRALQKQIREMHAAGKANTPEFVQVYSTYIEKMDQQARAEEAAAKEKRLALPPIQSRKPMIPNGASPKSRAAQTARIEYFQELDRVRTAVARGEAPADAVQVWLTRNTARFEAIDQLMFEAAEEARIQSKVQAQHRPTSSVYKAPRNLPPKMQALVKAQRSMQAEIEQAEAQYPESSEERSKAIAAIQKNYFDQLEQLRAEADAEARASVAPKS